jgi:hypothetical protein
MNRSKGWTGSSPNPWRNLKARPDRAFNGLCLGFENLFPGCAIGRAAIPPLQGQWLQNYFGLLRRTTNR